MSCDTSSGSPKAPSTNAVWRPARPRAHARVARPGLQRLERGCVTEGAADFGPVHRKRASLEVLAPRRVGRRDAERGRRDETEARVVVGMPEENDDGIVE